MTLGTMHCSGVSAVIAVSLRALLAASGRRRQTTAPPQRWQSCPDAQTEPRKSAKLPLWDFAERCVACVCLCPPRSLPFCGDMSNLSGRHGAGIQGESGCFLVVTFHPAGPFIPMQLLQRDGCAL